MHEPESSTNVSPVRVMNTPTQSVHLTDTGPSSFRHVMPPSSNATLDTEPSHFTRAGSRVASVAVGAGTCSANGPAGTRSRTAPPAAKRLSE